MSEMAASADAPTTGLKFEVPKVFVNEEGWGPTSRCLPTQFLNLPFAPFGKGERLGKAADFTQSAHYQARQQQRNARGNDPKYSNAEFQYKHDTQEDQSFHLVDTAKANSAKRFGVNLRRPWQNRGRGRWGDRGRGGRDGRGRGGDGYGGGKGGFGDGGPGRGRGHDARRGARGGRGGGRWGDRRNNNQQRSDRQASVKIMADWNVRRRAENGRRAPEQRGGSEGNKRARARARARPSSRARAARRRPPALSRTARAGPRGV